MEFKETGQFKTGVKALDKILREVLAKDKSILGRRDELIAALEEKVPGNLKRDFTPIKKAISLNVGEKFLVGEQNKEAKLRAWREFIKKQKTNPHNL